MFRGLLSAFSFTTENYRCLHTAVAIFKFMRSLTFLSSTTCAPKLRAWRTSAFSVAALLAPITPPPMLADTRPTALLALPPHPPMLTDARPFWRCNASVHVAGCTPDHADGPLRPSASLHTTTPATGCCPRLSLSLYLSPSLLIRLYEAALEAANDVRPEAACSPSLGNADSSECGG